MFMSIVLIIAIAIAMYGMKINLHGHNKDYLSRNRTTAVNGIFVMFVFMRHFGSYVDLKGGGYKLFRIVDGRLGQLIVGDCTKFVTVSLNMFIINSE